MNDLISRRAAIKEIDSYLLSFTAIDRNYYEGLRDAQRLLHSLPSVEPERKKGKWLEKHHDYFDEESVIEEWQSCKCSECGRYDTRPYLYYFSEPKFCSWCGADMRGEEE